jgi:DDE superfamily endonuclease
VRIPGTRRTWAVPVLTTLYRTPKESRRLGVRHKTPSELMQGLLCVWMRWFPQRIAVFSGDGAFATHRLSQFAARYRQRFALVSKLVPDAALYEPPPARKQGQTGRPRVVGKRLPSPKQAVTEAGKRTRHRVSWYGGGTRRVEVATGVGHWYRQGQGLVKIRWVYVHDLTGDHRDEYLYSTDCSMTAKQIIEAYVGRWDIEVTFEDMREHLGLETTRGRSERTVLRVEPCLFALYTVIALWYAELTSGKQATIWYRWPGKSAITFTDALTAVRRNAWQACLFQQPEIATHIDKLPPEAKKVVLDALSLAT